MHRPRQELLPSAQQVGCASVEPEIVHVEPLFEAYTSTLHQVDTLCREPQPPLRRPQTQLLEGPTWTQVKLVKRAGAPVEAGGLVQALADGRFLLLQQFIKRRQFAD